MFKIKLLLDIVRKKSPSQIAVKIVLGIAEGKFGTKAQSIYQALEGLKTWTAIVIAVVTFGLEKAAVAGLCEQCGDYALYAYSVSAFLLTVGLLDGAVRAEAPKKLTPFRR